MFQQKSSRATGSKKQGNKWEKVYMDVHEWVREGAVEQWRERGMGDAGELAKNNRH